jgi:drug/metabolite transporter (DMT)-like permease
MPGASSNVKLGLIWSYCGTLVLVPLALKSKNPWFEDYPNHLRRQAIGVVVSMLGGISMGLSFVCLQTAFAIDPRNAAPLQAVVAADVIIFAIYCHFVYKEKLNLIQWLSVIILFVSISVMSFGSGNSESAVSNHRNDAIAWAFGGMICFFLLNVTLRLRFTFPITTSGDFSFRMLTVGAMGLVTLTNVGSFQTEMLPVSARNWTLWISPLAVAVLQGLGTLSVVQAFKHHASSNITVAIMGCGCIVVLILEVVFDRMLPGTWQLVGMSLAVGSVMMMSLMGKVDNQTCSDTASSSASSPVSTCGAI